MPSSRVSIVDDDISVRESLPELLRQFGFEAKTFSSGEEFLGSSHIENSDCLILDVNMPGMSGPDVKDELDRRGYTVPVIFITAHSETAARLDACQGSMGCLVKPFTDTMLLEKLNRAISKA